MYHDNCPLCRAQRLADQEGRPVRMRDVLAAVRRKPAKS